ncbi:DMT family transporter [Cognatishimia activa]|uniref:DMT family transporter n=1 Tax=Cognatishimia activa TaxID=1715691 RepID=A0A975I9K4_9RHOB|nr:DMT family transporter [Cognatishimia activa]QTN36986.1 DMT family transporter [Cognatishimia activa]
MPSSRGILFKVIALFLFSIMASLVKASAPHVPSYQAVFFRSFFAMPIILIWLAQRHDLRTGLKTQNPFGHLWRGLIGTSAMVMGFSALGILPLPEVTAIGFAAPLFTVILAALLLGETIRIFRLTALAIGLIGVAIIIAPRLTVFELGGIESIMLIGALLALGSAFLRALAVVHVRRLVKTEETAAIVFYFSLTATCASLATVPLGWVWPEPREFVFLISAGLVGGVAQIFLTTGYRYAQASTLAPFDYLSMLFALIIGYFIFAEVPTVATLAGASIVIFAGILIIYRERKLGLERGKARPTVTPQG